MKVTNKTWLDFVIIGAQKSGTTTLFKYLAAHPDIYMPAEKESPFFSHDEYYGKGWEWYVEGTFGEVSEDRVWGKASPQYMCFPQVPARMSQVLPDVKCIAILRDPVTRAYSHYRMSTRRGYESRSFEQCVQAQLRPSALKESRLDPTKVNSYVTWGEYGRVLMTYREYFSSEQLLVLFTRDLAANPAEVWLTICQYLGVSSFLPDSLGEKFHKGGTRPKVPVLNRLLSAVPTRALRRRIPLRWWRALERWYLAFDQWNMKPTQEDRLPLQVETLKALEDHYKADAALLERVTSVPAPWLYNPHLIVGGKSHRNDERAEHAATEHSPRTKEGGCD